MAVFWLSAVVLVAGLAIGVSWLVSRPTEGGEMRILDERLARGEIDTDEHRERASVLTRGRRNVLGPLALVMILVGFGGVGGALAAASSSGGGMSQMMGGDRDPGMMDGMGGMMGGQGGSAPSPRPGAEAQDIVATEYAFSPDEIRVRIGETVNITLDNRGEIFHTFTVPDLGFELSAQGGETDEGSLGSRESGTHRFVCTVPGHAEAGMEGTVVVTEGG